MCLKLAREHGLLERRRILNREMVLHVAKLTDMEVYSATATFGHAIIMFVSRCLKHASQCIMLLLSRPQECVLVRCAAVRQHAYANVSEDRPQAQRRAGKVFLAAVVPGSSYNLAACMIRNTDFQGSGIHCVVSGYPILSLLAPSTSCCFRLACWWISFQQAAAASFSSASALYSAFIEDTAGVGRLALLHVPHLEAHGT